MSGGDIWRRRVLTIANTRGLHARASAKLVQAAGKFPSEITVSKDGITVSARSIMGLMTLAAVQGSEIEIAASGPQSAEALEALAALVSRGFGEE